MACDFKTRFAIQTTVLLYLSTSILSAPPSNRKGKYLFDLIPQSNNIGSYQNDISRTIPSDPHPYNSPIYYIRLPPIPYSFVPGLGYVSQSNPAQQNLVNLPLPFLGNGKPVTVYQWSGAYDGFSKPTPKPVQKPIIRPDSPVHRIPGQFVFNGKPDDVFLLRDSYNALYDDTLQNLYP